MSKRLFDKQRLRSASQHSRDGSKNRASRNTTGPNRRSSQRTARSAPSHPPSRASAGRRRSIGLRLVLCGHGISVTSRKPIEMQATVDSISCGEYPPDRTQIRDERGDFIRFFFFTNSRAGTRAFDEHEIASCCSVPLPEFVDVTRSHSGSRSSPAATVFTLMP